MNASADRSQVQDTRESCANLSTFTAYVEVKRIWKSGVTIALTLPKRLWKAELPDNPNKARLMWRPLVLASDMSSMARAVDSRGAQQSRPESLRALAGRQPGEET